MSDLPRILLCSFDVVPSPTGASRRMTEYLKALNGRYSTVVLSTKTADVSHIERYHGARLLRVPVGQGDLSSRTQAFERAVKRQLESEEYAIVHFMDPFGGYPLCELRVDHEYRVVYDAQSFPSMELRYTHPQLEGDRKVVAKVRRQELYCLMNADKVITGAPTTQRHIVSMGVPPENVHVLRAPVDPAAYAPKIVGEPTSSPMRILYLGSQVGWQGIPVLLRAFKRVIAEVQATLTLAGPRHPEWQKRLEDVVGELGLGAHVTFAPAVPADDLPKLLAGSDVGVLPLEDVERNRIQGGELAKASDHLAAGRPLVASDLALTRELLPASATRFFPPANEDALAAILVELARKPELRAELGRAARAEAQNLVSSAVLKPAILAVYAELLRRSGLQAPTEVQEGRDPTGLTATPTNQVLGGKSDSGPTPTGRTGVITPTGRHAASEPLPDTDPALALANQKPTWTPAPPARRKAKAEGGWTPTGTFVPPPSRSEEDPPTAISESIEEVQLEDIIERIDTFSGPAPRAPVSPQAQGGERDDPWLAQLLYGYCPPDGVQFARHTPPTNFPGRDETGRSPA